MTKAAGRKGYVAMKSYAPGAVEVPPRLPPGGEGLGRWDVLTRLPLPDGSAVVSWAWAWDRPDKEGTA